MVWAHLKTGQMHSLKDFEHEIQRKMKDLHQDGNNKLE
jgi:hypothetical protein